MTEHTGTLEFVDTHCHLDFDETLKDDRACLARARAAGIHKMVNICTTLEEFDQIVETAKNNAGVFATVGIHPHEAEPTLEQISLPKLGDWLREGTKNRPVVAIGETGLDYFYENSPKAAQRDVFETHIKIAKEVDYPLSVHTRSAREDTIDLLRTVAPGVRGTIHCFSEDLSFAKDVLNLGFYISVSGIATFKNANAIREAIAYAPLDRLLLETDAPYLAPVPHRGKPNEPAYLVETAKVVAELKGISLKDLARATTENFYRLFSRAHEIDNQ